MGVGAEVAWDGADFILFGAMLLAACCAFELATRRTGSAAYRAGIGAATGAAFLLVWMNLAVGLIGPEDHPANRLVIVVLAVAAIGAGAGRFRPRAMAGTLAAMALAQVLVGLAAAIAGWDRPLEILGVTGLFAALWLAAAALFRRAAREEKP
jgi:hypothetical protein